MWKLKDNTNESTYNTEFLITDYSREEVGGWWQRDMYTNYIKYIYSKDLLYNAGNYIHYLITCEKNHWCMPEADTILQI